MSTVNFVLMYGKILYSPNYEQKDAGDLVAQLPAYCTPDQQVITKYRQRVNQKLDQFLWVGGWVGETCNQLMSHPVGVIILPVTSYLENGTRSSSDGPPTI